MKKIGKLKAGYTVPNAKPPAPKPSGASNEQAKAQARAQAVGMTRSPIKPPGGIKGTSTRSATKKK